VGRSTAIERLTAAAAAALRHRIAQRREVSSLAMCTRYAVPDQQTVEGEFSPRRTWWKFTERFNVAPAQRTPVVRLHERESEGVVMRWGLIPSWTKGTLGAGRAEIHAPSEAVQTSSLFGPIWRESQRCIVPLAGFYVWQLTNARYRQPYFVQFLGQPVFGVAAVWDRWVTDEDDVIESCALITAPPNSLLADVQGSSQSMPAILRREDYELWLHGKPGEVHALLRTYPAERMLTHPVSPRVNSLVEDDWLLARAVRS